LRSRSADTHHIQGACRSVNAINNDAHATPHLDVLRFGVPTAQPGWLTADVINTWPQTRLRAFLQIQKTVANAVT
jgi:histidinol phosphatase-like PHP family hydrolase